MSKCFKRLIISKMQCYFPWFTFASIVPFHMQCTVWTSVKHRTANETILMTQIFTWNNISMTIVTYFVALLTLKKEEWKCDCWCTVQFIVLIGLKYQTHGQRKVKSYRNRIDMIKSPTWWSRCLKVRVYLTSIECLFNRSIWVMLIFSETCL